MRAESSKLAVFGLVALAAGSLVVGPASADVLKPYGFGLAGGTPGYKYTIQGLNTDIPGFAAPSFDDSAWTSGAMPIGSPGTAPYACSWLWPEVETPWDPPASDLFVRFHQQLCNGAKSVRIGVSIDNDISVFANGVEVLPVGGCAAESLDGLCVSEGCATPDMLVYQVPDSALVPGGGDNVFAIHARDREIVAFLDVELSADLSEQDCTPVQFNYPPDCSGAFASPSQLWPPNHKWNEITIAGPADPDGDEIAVTITSIFQDEPTDAKGNGDGNTCPDGAGVGTGSASVRAERAGGADGRVYHIGFTASDPLGNSCTGSVAVCVPHDQGNGNNCIDQGALFDSTTCP